MSPRKLAIEQGNATYFTGKPCPNGHVADRFVSTRACKDCLLEKKAAWNKANPEKVNAQKRAWIGANLEYSKKLKSESQKKHRASANERNRRYAEMHRDQIKVATARWQKEHPELVTAKAARYRAAKLMQMPAWADHAAIELVYQRASDMRAAGLDVHVDHIVPLQGRLVRGLHVHNNLRIIEAKANRSKSNFYKE